jgi:hypothetical protein
MASEEFSKKMALHNLKKCLDTLQDIDFVAELDDSFPSESAYEVSLAMTATNYVEKAFLPKPSSQELIDDWSCRMVDSFQLGEIFYIYLNDFGVWSKVQVRGDARQWFLPLARTLTYFVFHFTPLDYQRLCILTSEEHKFTASTESL